MAKKKALLKTDSGSFFVSIQGKRTQKSAILASSWVVKECEMVAKAGKQCQISKR